MCHDSRVRKELRGLMLLAIIVNASLYIGFFCALSCHMVCIVWNFSYKKNVAYVPLSTSYCLLVTFVAGEIKFSRLLSESFILCCCKSYVLCTKWNEAVPLRKQEWLPVGMWVVKSTTKARWRMLSFTWWWHHVSQLLVQRGWLVCQVNKSASNIIMLLPSFSLLVLFSTAPKSFLRASHVHAGHSFYGLQWILQLNVPLPAHIPFSSIVPLLGSHF